MIATAGTYSTATETTWGYPLVGVDDYESVDIAKSNHESIVIVVYNNFDLVRMVHERAFRLLIASMFNVYVAAYYRKDLFSKSGFIGRCAKRRKN